MYERQVDRLESKLSSSETKIDKFQASLQEQQIKLMMHSRSRYARARYPEEENDLDCLTTSFKQEKIKRKRPCSKPLSEASGGNKTIEIVCNRA